VADVECDVLVVGGGPAGMAAGTETARAGLHTILVEERESLGGQVYRQRPVEFPDDGPGDRHRRVGRRMAMAYRSAGGQVWTGRTVWDLRRGHAYVSGAQGGLRVRFRAVVIATGAFDRPVVFPGWTLPGVITAGGAHALALSQGVSPGERVLLAGTGPLAIAFAADMVRAGVPLVKAVDPAAPMGIQNYARIAATAQGNWRTLAEGARHLAVLRKARIRIQYRTTIIEAVGDTQVRHAVIAAVDSEWRPIAGTERRVDVDTVCVGYGFRPSTELTDLAGCVHTESAESHLRSPLVDPFGRSTVGGVYAAGDGVAPEGSAVAAFSGTLTGIAVATDLGALPRRVGRRPTCHAQRRRRAARRLRVAVDFRRTGGAGLDSMATADTELCRCENVTRGEAELAVAAGATDADALKRVTRAGMGWCQARNCELAIQAVLRASGYASPGVMRRRPPARPIALSHLMEHDDTDGVRSPIGNSRAIWPDFRSS
jgi:thioredoxin reductase